MKVLILRAMLSRADILLLDEVCAYEHKRSKACLRGSMVAQSPLLSLSPYVPELTDLSYLISSLENAHTHSQRITWIMHPLPG
jgi:hypothetical protein